MSTVVVEIECVVAAPREQVWARVASSEGINHELMPWLSMSIPRGHADLDVHSLPVGEPLGKSWLRLFGVLPVDYDDLTVVELDPGRRFHERSRMLSARRWEHERTLEPLGPATTCVIDRLTIEPRGPLRLLMPVVAGTVRQLFAHRHRRLKAWFS